MTRSPMSSVHILECEEKIMKTLIRNANAFLPSGKAEPVDIAIDGNKIVTVGKADENFTADVTIEAKGKMAVPGFVNAHTHASMTLLRSYADDMNLMDWLQNKIWPIEAKMKKNDIYWGAMLAGVEMIRTGTTTFADMYGDMEKVAEMSIESGMRSVLARGIIGVAPNGEQAFEENKALFRDYNGAGLMLRIHALPISCEESRGRRSWTRRRCISISPRRRARSPIACATIKLLRSA